MNKKLVCLPFFSSEIIRSFVIGSCKFIREEETFPGK